MPFNNSDRTTLKESMIKNSQEHYKMYDHPTPLDKMVKGFREFIIDLIIQRVGMKIADTTISEELGCLLFDHLIELNTSIAYNMVNKLSANSNETIPEFQKRLKEHADGKELNSFVDYTCMIIKNKLI